MIRIDVSIDVPSPAFPEGYKVLKNSGNGKKKLMKF